jgi:hypothetical protein
MTGTICLGSGRPTSSGSTSMRSSATARRSGPKRSNGPDSRPRITKQRRRWPLRAHGVPVP